jgi:hypothetical protein
MKATIQDCKDTFKIGYEAYISSREEAEEVRNLYHNRHYTEEQLTTLENRGQPKETFNVVKLFARMLVGYYSTVVNTAVVRPRHPRHVINATMLNDTINYIFERNRFDIEGDKIKLNGLLTGLLCSITEVVATGEKDQFGRPLNFIELHNVPESELVLDPTSTMDDYSDASFLHRYKWLTESTILKRFGKEVLAKLTAYYNFTDANEADFGYRYGNDFVYGGYYKVHDNYLVVHTVLEDDDGKRWSIFWHDEVILSKKEITYKETRWPYRVQRLHSTDRCEYYGLFREIIEPQKAINQALLQIQLMANTTKVFIEGNAVEDVAQFTSAINRVNAVIPVLKMSGIHIEKMTNDILQQYTIIDKALDRIQRVLGINDSFLGMAYASDSGRKVKLQQGATIMSLRYVTARIESFYTSLAYDVGNLAKQYFTANQFLRLTDAMTGERWQEINKPMTEFSGQMDANGQPIYQPIMMEVLDPGSKEPLEDEEGNLIFAPVPEQGTDFEFMPFDIKVESSAYNDEDEKGQLMLESVMSGQIGQMLAQVDPARFFKISSLAMKTMGTKYSPQISSLLDEVANNLGGNQQAQQSASNMAQGNSGGQAPMSSALKLPQNTNEGI